MKPKPRFFKPDPDPISFLFSVYILTDAAFGKFPPDFGGPIQFLYKHFRNVHIIVPPFLSIIVVRFGDGVQGGFGEQYINEGLDEVAKSVPESL